MKRFLLWIWQFPQNIIGYLMTRRPEHVGMVSVEHMFPVYFTNNVFNSGVCLGDYIILDYQKYCGTKFSADAKKHEYGHHIQSLIFGPLYLFIIGLPSVIRNLYGRYRMNDKTVEEKLKWYYSGYPERWADKLGKVERFDD